MERLFRFDMYPADWLIDTSRLTPEECGLYIQIICLIYARRGPVDNDPKELSRKLTDCSSRKAAAIISSLVQKGFVTLSAGKIAQKRAESELNTKRTHLERSSNGGRTKAENEAERNKNNELNSSGEQFSVPTPSHPQSIPISIAIAIEDLDQGKTPSPKINLSDFSIMNLLDQDGLMDARVFSSAAGQDLNELARVYDNAVKQAIMEKPRKPNQAFPAWIRSISKGKRT